MTRFGVIAMMLVGTTPATAWGQASDLIVMRKVMNPEILPSSWVTGDWKSQGSTCSGSVQQTRTVECRTKGGSHVDTCLSDPPASTQTAPFYAGCSYDWQTTAWSVVPACGETTQRRDVYCVRSDGLRAESAQCDVAHRPPESARTTSDATCGYAWKTGTYGEWSSTCSTTSKRYAPVTCEITPGVQATDAKCLERVGPKPTGEQVSDISTGCVAAWDVGPWNAPGTTCGTVTKTRSVTCVRRDPLTGANYAAATDQSLCSAATKPATSETTEIQTGCNYLWVQFGETFGGTTSRCVDGQMKTEVVSECTPRNSPTYVVNEGNCTTRRPISKTYNCSLNSLGAQTNNMGIYDARYDHAIGARAIVKTYPGILTDAEAKARARDLCKAVDYYYTKDSVSCAISFQTNAKIGTSRIAVGVDAYEIPGRADLSTYDTGWVKTGIWSISFSETSPVGVDVNVTGDATGKKGPSNCGVAVKTQEYGNVKTAFRCIGQ